MKAKFKKKKLRIVQILYGEIVCVVFVMKTKCSKCAIYTL